MFLKSNSVCLIFILAVFYCLPNELNAFISTKPLKKFQLINNYKIGDPELFNKFVVLFNLPKASDFSSEVAEEFLRNLDYDIRIPLFEESKVIKLNKKSKNLLREFKRGCRIVLGMSYPLENKSKTIFSGKIVEGHKSSIESSLNDSTRIINGQIAPPRSFPFIVSLGFMTLSGYQHSCGGSILSDQHIITGAQCVNSLGNAYKYEDYFRRNRRFLVAVAGSNTINGYDYFSVFNETNIFLIRTVSSNPNYKNKTSPEDVAVLTTDKKIIFNAYIDQIKLAESTDPSVIFGKRLTALGWGKTASDKFSNELITTDLTVTNGNQKNKCEGLDKMDYCMEDLTKKDSNICFGDFGGPLIRFENYEWFLYGIASFVFTDPNGKCLNEYPSFFAMVPVLKSWILDQMS
ncbi:unnamed protein product [Brachionus calyciflorus]|uniref:Peptidase S1 domain-containing protein n=1 Tax=Brachionus calyciflorus TaxID=104777 RepID=A0A813M5Q6_9BILA|nr:unnamed protein product [Brachionus calyciflorus]